MQTVGGRSGAELVIEPVVVVDGRVLQATQVAVVLGAPPTTSIPGGTMVMMAEMKMTTTARRRKRKKVTGGILGTRAEGGGTLVDRRRQAKEEGHGVILEVAAAGVTLEVATEVAVVAGALLAETAGVLLEEETVGVPLAKLVGGEVLVDTKVMKKGDLRENLPLTVDGVLPRAQIMGGAHIAKIMLVTGDGATLNASRLLTVGGDILFQLVVMIGESLVVEGGANQKTATGKRRQSIEACWIDLGGHTVRINQILNGRSSTRRMKRNTTKTKRTKMTMRKRNMMTLMTCTLKQEGMKTKLVAMPTSHREYLTSINLLTIAVL